MKEKKHILSAYQEKCGVGHPYLIITKKKGKMADKKSLTWDPVLTNHIK
jgi:hypothetical protein